MTPSEQPAPAPVATPRDTFEVHKQMVMALFVATTFLCALLAAGLYLSQVSALMAVAAGGALGGFVSALRRLYAFQRVFPADFFRNSRRINSYLVIYSLIPPLVGLIAAITLYLIFAAGLIKGDIFPTFALAATDPQASPFHNFVNNWTPATPTDYAKTLVWAFIAGFSERFVPDLLERLGSKQDRPPEGKRA